MLTVLGNGSSTDQIKGSKNFILSVSSTKHIIDLLAKNSSDALSSLGNALKTEDHGGDC